MEVDYILALVAIVYTIPLGWLFILVSRTNDRMDEVQKTSYTKEETEKMIELHNRPVLQAVESVKADITEIKHMIGKLFDAQTNKG